MAPLVGEHVQAASTTNKPSATKPTSPERPRFRVLNLEEFRKVIADGTVLRVLANNINRFTQGPAWNEKEQSLIFSETPTNTLYKWTPDHGITIFRQPSHYSTGNAFDLQGRLLTGEVENGRIVRTELDGTIRPLVQEYDGKKLNSPTDFAVKSDGSIWFVDPDFRHPNGTPSEQGGNFVYRYDPATDHCIRVADDFEKPSGLCFSPDEKRLYVTDYQTKSNLVYRIRAFDVQADGILKNGTTVTDVVPGSPGGIRCDEHGRIWTVAANGVHIYKKDGSPVGQILTSLPPSGLCWGGGQGRTLFITARRFLYAIDTLVAGAGPTRVAAKP